MVFLFSLFLAVPAISQTDVQSIFPENDLWMEDALENNSNIDEQMFNRIIDAGLEVYQPIAKKYGDKKLTINRRWNDSTVNANCIRRWGSVTVNMFGGLARRKEITPEGFLLVLCHELGHAYGGKPYIRGDMSAEGQADYYGANVCTKLVLQKLHLDGYIIAPTNYMERVCGAAKSQEACVRTLTAGQSLGNLMAPLMKQEIPSYETPDPLKVSKTLTSYPKTIQCRLDTYLNGALDRDRPACWFKK
jgi:hypothetical protein